MGEGNMERDHLGKAHEIDASPPISFNAPAFLNVQNRATIKASIRPRSVLSQSAVSTLKRFTGILRGHIEQDAPKIKREGQGGGIAGVIVTVLVLLAIIICVGAVIAVNQIRLLKSEITTLERQLVPLKNQAANAEQQEKRNSSDERNPAKAVATDKSKPTDENHSASTTLILSPDEKRLIREYIKPAPLSGPTAQPVNVGDPVTVGTIPLPSPLTDKISKLLGARFTIHNGSIILLRRDSHQADAVLGPN
jgi:cell division protein FtsL